MGFLSKIRLGYESLMLLLFTQTCAFTALVVRK